MYVRRVSVRNGTEIQVQGEKGMIKRSDVKEHVFLYCSSGWWWVSNTIRLLWIYLEESCNSSEYAHHTYVYAQIWIYTDTVSLPHAQIWICGFNWLQTEKTIQEKKSFQKVPKSKTQICCTLANIFYISFTLNLKLFAWLTLY